MVKLCYAALITFLCLLPAIGDDTAEIIIKKVEDNQSFTTQKYSAVMIIIKGERKLVKKFYGFSKDEGGKSFMTFTNPEDSGVKYLKIIDELWIYFPDADDIMKISGHLLKQGLMGSDISYEDMMESEKYKTQYDPVFSGDEVFRDRKCSRITLSAISPQARYEKQIMLIDTQYNVPLKIELYAKGGRLIRIIEEENIKKIQDKYIAHKITIRDLRKKDSITHIEFEDIQINEPLDDSVFTKGNLKK